MGVEVRVVDGGQGVVLPSSLGGGNKATQTDCMPLCLVEGRGSMLALVLGHVAEAD